MIHEDERRRLEGWPEAKIITAKEDCILGNHYHKIKTEIFILTVGSAVMILEGETYPMIKGAMYSVYPNQKHSFELKKNSILIGLCSHPYNPNDDFRE